MADIENATSETTGEIENNTTPDDLGNLLDLINVCDDILTERNSGGLVTQKRRDAYGTFLSKYRMLIEGEGVQDPSFSDHIDYIYSLYVKKRSSILNTIDDDSWIEHEDTCIWFGENNPTLKKKNIKICIYVFFIKGHEIKSKLDVELKEHERMEKDAYFYADELLYFLLKCFKQCIVGTKYEQDADRLQDAITQISDEMGMQEDVPRKKTAGFDTFLGPMMGTLGGIADSAGIKLPDGTPISKMLENIDGAKIQEAIMGFVKNPEMMEKIGSAVGSLGINASQGTQGTPGQPPDFSGMVAGLAQGFGQMMSAGPPSAVGGDNMTEEEKAQQTQQAKQMEESMSNMASVAMGAISQIFPGTNPNQDKDVKETD